MTESDGLGVGVRAALHALDAALAEHRRGALAVAASRREAERMAHARAVKAAAAAAKAALEQPVARPMRGLRIAETWVEADRTRRPLADAVRAAVEGGASSSCGVKGWSARLPVAPGEGPPRPRPKRSRGCRRRRRPPPSAPGCVFQRVVAAEIAYARVAHDAVLALAAADRDAAERHADGARVEEAAAELAERLGPRWPDEPAEVRATRGRLDQARVHLATVPAQPYA